MMAAACSGGGVLDICSYLDDLERTLPEQLLRVRKPLNPAEFEVTAVLQQLENRGLYPLVYFERPLNLLGERSEFDLVTNVYATRERCALALGLEPEQAELPLSLEYARREKEQLPPVHVSASEAPCKQVVWRGEEVDLRTLPIVRHHEMDAGPYIDMAVVVREPEGGGYNAAFQRTMYKGPRKLGIHMSPRHNWQVQRRQEEAGQPTRVVIVASHHPSFYLGTLNVSPFGTDDYAIIGAVAGRPLRLTPSETWGEEFMVPADADVLIEGEIPPNVREVEGPFGEFTGYYGPQRVRWVIDVTALTYRRGAIFQDIFSGHREVWNMGGIPKEGAIYNRIKGVVPTVRAVHLPVSGTGRFHCYISLDKKVEGESKQAALIALGEVDFVKHVVVVDADINPFREEEVLWAMATRVQADRDVDVIKDVKGNTLDPSQTDDITTAKMIVDATKPVRRPFEERIRVPAEAMAKVDLDELLAEAGSGGVGERGSGGSRTRGGGDAETRGDGEEPTERRVEAR